MGVEIKVDGLTKSFGRQLIWGDVTLTVPAGEICVMLGPGKAVFLKALVGLLRPDRGSIVIKGTDIASCSEKELYEIRKLFGVLFQDGAMFGSMNLYDNVEFPLREQTKGTESEIRDIVMEKMDLVGLFGAEDKLPGEISGGMRKRAGLARALVLEPGIVLFDEPDSGVDLVRTAFLNQLIVDLNARIDATFLIVTHYINTARTVPDNIGLLYHRHLAMFGPREMLLSFRGAGRRAVPQRPARRAHRHVGGEGRRQARGGEGRGDAAAAADPAPARALQRHPAPQPARAGRLVSRVRGDPAPRFLPQRAGQRRNACASGQGLDASSGPCLSAGADDL